MATRRLHSLASEFIVPASNWVWVALVMAMMPLQGLVRFAPETWNDGIESWFTREAASSAISDSYLSLKQELPE
ncbi:hypothetical protein HZ326_24281 [Fusarium oxysporum f. sp. albedinis]|nr:hypothetical protein HZ326_24281 [Fusarium oxysporum f. sp. albedinis]